MDAEQVSDSDLEEALGRFEGRVPFMALSYTAFSLGITTPNSAMVGASFMGSFGIDAVIFKTLEPRDRERRHGAVAGMDDSP